jgi:molecular chaperone GrpE
MYKHEIPAEYLARRSPEIQQNQFNTIYRMQHDNTDIRPKDPEIETLKSDLAQERERYLRLAADFDNHRKRTGRDLERRTASQKEALARDLLPAIDNFERALAANPGEDLREGVEMIYKQVVETMKRHGFEPRDDVGQPFDGRVHDAIAVGTKPEMPDLSIIEVWERGWMRGAEMFRPAKVLVNKLSDEDSLILQTKETVNA